MPNHDDAHLDINGKIKYTQSTKWPSFDIIQNISKRIMHSHTPPFYDGKTYEELGVFIKAPPKYVHHKTFYFSAILQYRKQTNT